VRPGSFFSYELYINFVGLEQYLHTPRLPPTIPMAITYISKARELSKTASAINQFPEIGLDLEFDKNRYRYGFNLCLIQISAGSECYLIDPLNGLDVSPVFSILEDPKIQKIVFAFGEDLRLLHSLDCFPKNIYDINIATSLLNYQPASLFNYLNDILGLNMGRSSQQSNWYKRPLSDRQMSYAAKDVLHLIKLKDVLHEESVRKNIDLWIEQENREFDNLDFADLNDKTYIREEDKNSFTEYEWYLFCQILELREAFAKKHNRPSYQIIKKEKLEKIVQNGLSFKEIQTSTILYRGLDSENFWQQIHTTLEQAQEEAAQLNLSNKKPAEPKPTEQERIDIRNQKQKLNQQINQYLKPIKEKIAEKYGKQTASYLLSNRNMKELIEGSQSVTKPYKRDLFIETAQELNIDQNALLKIIS